jgi:toxin ParE1/3/4
VPNQITRLPASLRDVEEQVDYLCTCSIEAAHRYIDAIEATFQFLLENREAGQRCQFTDPRAAGIRVWQVQKFRNYLVFYRPTDDGIVIERVLHGARNIDALFSQDI